MATSYNWEDRGQGGTHADDLYVSKLTIPVAGGGTADYFIRDEQSRAKIQDILDSISSGVVFIGKTNTPLTDGSATATITLKESGAYTKQVTLTAEDVGSLVTVDKTAYTPALKQDAEYIWDGAQWIEFGSSGELGDFAFVDTGDVVVDRLVDTSATHTATISTTPTGATYDDTKAPTVELTDGTVSGSVGTALTGTATYNEATGISAAAPSGSETANYTPDGEVNVTAASGATGEVVTGVTITATDSASKLTGTGASVVPSYSFVVGASDETLTITPATAITAVQTSDLTAVTDIPTGVSVSTGDLDFDGTGVVLDVTTTPGNVDTSGLALADGTVSGTVDDTSVTFTPQADWIKYDKADASATVNITTTHDTFTATPHTGA
jgi:hypothetical protein